MIELTREVRISIEIVIENLNMSVKSRSPILLGLLLRNDPYVRSVVELGETMAANFFPLYYVADIPELKDLDLVEKMWKLVKLGSSETFSADRQKASNAASLYSTCFEYFCDIFFDNLLEAQPSLASFFKSPEFRTKWLIKFFGVIFDNMGDDYEFNKAIQQMARSHCKKGLSAKEFSLIGEMIFYSFGRVLRDEYTCEAHVSWVRLMSLILRIMVPVTIVCEINKSNGRDDRIPIYGDWDRCVKPISRKPKIKGRMKSFFKTLMNWKNNDIHAIHEEPGEFSVRHIEDPWYYEV